MSVHLSYMQVGHTLVFIKNFRVFVILTESYTYYVYQYQDNEKFLPVTLYQISVIGNPVCKLDKCPAILYE